MMRSDRVGDLRYASLSDAIRVLYNVDSIRYNFNCDKTWRDARLCFQVFGLKKVPVRGETRVAFPSIISRIVSSREKRKLENVW